ncbi:maleylpyruvate isomerase family mycothiol-dependent enzyme [Knoellia subterranea]|uniref:maleylpyruvate isomerase family mycothiol-dependent enzyme n=1 Tax=Knoellia subterranea TaxID=184882 RepID=UPI001B7FF5AD|nr:maleylpyruvate isomerase family mycothiol-dependent enzyme [Knoellia subterranea]
MTTMTDRDVDRLWAAMDDQRDRTASMLETLTIDDWLHPSLCEGWNVRQVAAHLTLQQLTIRESLAFTLAHPEVMRGLTLNRTIQDLAVAQARTVEPAEIIARIRGMIGSRRHNAFVTPLEALTDSLVHSQDIAIPLGIDLTMDPEAAVRVANRRWETRHGWQARVFRKVPLDTHRFTATDIDWSRGDGPEVVGPIAPLLLVLCGRMVALDRLTGDGVEQLRHRA